MQSQLPDFSDVYTTSLYGAAKQFECFFDNIQTPVVTVSNNNHMRAYARKYREMKFPYFAIQRTSVAVNTTDGLPAKNTRRTGVRGERTDFNIDNYIYNLIPVEVTLRVIFMCQTEIHRIEFEQQWLYTAVGGDLKFYLETSDSSFRFPINMVFDQNLTLPDFENDDIGEIFSIESSVRLTTYIGKTKIIKAVTTPKGSYLNEAGDAIFDRKIDVRTGTVESKAKSIVDGI